MKLRTLIDVTHADVTKPLTGGTLEGLVTMEINRIALVLNPLSTNEDNYIEVGFRYLDESDNILPTVTSGIVAIVGEDEIITLSTAINSPNSNLVGKIKQDVTAFAISQMASSFDILTTDIEIL